MIVNRLFRMLRQGPYPAIPLVLILVLAGSASAPVRAAEPKPPPAGPPAAELQQLVGTLQDPQQREHLIQQLQALLAAQRHDPPAPPEPAAVVDADDLIGQATGQAVQIGNDLVDTATMMIDLPSIADWLQAQIDDDKARDRWLAIGRHVGTILGAAILADILARLVAARLRRPRLDRVPAGRAARVGRLIGSLAIDAAPMAAFVGTGYVVMAIVQPKMITAHVSSIAMSAVFVARLLLLVGRTVLLSGTETGWSPLPFGEETAQYLYIWVRRFVFWSVYGFAFCAAFWWLGVPGSVEAVTLNVVALILAALTVVFVLQNRQPVAEWLRPRPAPAAQTGAEDGAEAILADPVTAQPPARRRQAVDLLRRRLAEIWHVLVIVYVVGIFVVFALRVENGFSYLFRATILSVAILVTAQLASRFAARLAERGFAIGADLSQRFPTLQNRANRYLPIFNSITAAVVWGTALLSLLECWGIDSYAWLISDTGRRVTGSLITIGTTLAIAFLVWEVINAAVERYLAGTRGNGDRIARSGRMRTLLPLLRNVLWVMLLVVVGLVVLSELGVNIAPLLGISAVAGVAIGFGSQALVKDIITGLFILIEDIMAVGDVVDFGGGYAGTVEAMSIRTIRLRDSHGTLQVIPFGEVAKIKNLARDYAYHVIELTLPFAADPDAVIRILTEIGTEMQADPVIGPMLAAPLEIMGLTGIGLDEFKLQARIKTRPLRQWDVQHAFNRRLKRALDAAGISAADGAHTIRLDPEVMALLERIRPATGAADQSAETAARDQAAAATAREQPAGVAAPREQSPVAATH